MATARESLAKQEAPRNNLSLSSSDELPSDCVRPTDASDEKTSCASLAF